MTDTPKFEVIDRRKIKKEEERIAPLPNPPRGPAPGPR